MAGEGDPVFGRKGSQFELRLDRTLGSVWILLDTRLPVVLVTCESGTYL